MEKKSHHYVARAYLRSFCNEDGRVCTYSKDRNGQFWFARPEAIGFENYYYSQPTPEGGRDNNRLEEGFGRFEEKWPPLVAKIGRSELDHGELISLLQFVLMHRVRVPTARDAHERVRAEWIRMAQRSLHEQGKLPPTPAGFDFDFLDQHTEVAIDPHTSIHAMVDLAKGMQRALDSAGYEILQNNSSEEFVTSDNPVVYFDPLKPENSIQPYNIDRQRMDVELFFAISPTLMLWGHSILRPQFATRGMLCKPLRELEFVRRANRLIVRFANKFVFARTDEHQALVREYASLSPVVEVTHMGSGANRMLIARSVFGKRKRKPKWTGAKDDKP